MLTWTSTLNQAKTPAHARKVLSVTTTTTIPIPVASAKAAVKISKLRETVTEPVSLTRRELKCARKYVSQQ